MGEYRRQYNYTQIDYAGVSLTTLFNASQKQAEDAAAALWRFGDVGGDSVLDCQNFTTVILDSDDDLYRETWDGLRVGQYNVPWVPVWKTVIGRSPVELPCRPERAPPPRGSTPLRPPISRGR